MITKATLDDVSFLNILVNYAYRGEHSKKGWTTEADILEGIRTSEEELAELIQKPDIAIFKFTINEEIEGCVMLEKKPAKLYLGMLTVSPELQNSGIGKALLKFSEVYAAELGLSRIVMTVISVRQELIAWYSRHGYLDTGKREPFPMDNPDFGLPKQKLEFVVLEKMV
jgi:ribosomal protein S18 acetylase RimI-like enzyme